MKIKADLLKVQHVDRAPDGTKIEPEQQAAARVITMDAPVEHGSIATGRTMPTQIIAETTAGVLAGKLRSMCRTCAYFNRSAWRRMVSESDSPAAPLEAREAVNKVREALLFTENAEVQEMHSTAHPDNDFDVDNAVMSMGVCRALTEHMKELVAVHPLSSCPITVAAPDRPEGFYKARSKDAERSATNAYDEVMAAAQGRLK